MGPTPSQNQQSLSNIYKPQHSSSPNSSVALKGQILPIVALNSLLDIAFQKIGPYEDTSSLQLAHKALTKEKQPGFQTGRNFQGNMDDKGNLNGMCRTYSSFQESFTDENQKRIDKKVYVVYFGKFRESKKVGEGIQAKSSIPKDDWEEMKLQQKILLNLNEVEIIKLDNWEKDTQQKGTYFSLIKKETVIFKGFFENRHFVNGVLEVKTQGRTFVKYSGKFNQYNQLNDHNGKLELVGKTTYSGGFKSNKREGYGIEEDENKKTKYIGCFSRDKKNGYGQMTYLNRDNIKLKGFWNDDIIKKNESVFVTANGLKLESVGDYMYI